MLREESLILELKSGEKADNIHKARILIYMKLAEIKKRAVNFYKNFLQY